jgi:hypothetical protein
MAEQSHLNFGWTATKVHAFQFAHPCSDHPFAVVTTRMSELSFTLFDLQKQLGGCIAPQRRPYNDRLH